MRLPLLGAADIFVTVTLQVTRDVVDLYSELL